jgi:hypothetical protein
MFVVGDIKILGDTLFKKFVIHTVLIVCNLKISFAQK